MEPKKVTLKSGKVRWEYTGEGPKDPATGKRIQIKRRGKTRKEVKKKVEDAIREMTIDGMDLSRSKQMTFSEIADEWLQFYAVSGKKDSSVRIRRKEINALNKKMGQTPIGLVDFRLYQKILYKLAPEYAENTLNGIHACANMIFKYAKKAKLLKENPANDVEIPKKKKTVEEIKGENIEQSYLETDELNEFLHAVMRIGLPLDSERFFTLAFSGMRPGELCALKQSDLDFEQNTIDISKTLYNPDNNMRKFSLTPPKTVGSIRIVEMEEEIMKMLDKVIHENKKCQLKYRNYFEDYLDDDFLFRRENGYPFIPKSLGDRMRRILKVTSIKKHATPHIFRHTHVSMLTEAGVDLPTIMHRVGHDDPDTTLRIYTHVTNKMKKDASVKVKHLYESTLQKISF